MPFVPYVPRKILKWVNASNARTYYILAAQSSASDTSSIQPVQLTQGHVAQPFIRYDQFESQFSMSGPALLYAYSRDYLENIQEEAFLGAYATPGPSSSGTTLSPNSPSNFGYPGSGTTQDRGTFVGDFVSADGIVDVPTIATEWAIRSLSGTTKTAQLGTWTLIPALDNTQSGSRPVLDKISLKISDRGLDADISWKGKTSNPPAIDYMSWVNEVGAVPLMRQSAWYDFVAEVGFYNPRVGAYETQTTCPIKNASFDFSFDYDTPTWIGRNMEPTYLLKQTRINWSVTIAFDLSDKFHIAPYRIDDYTYVSYGTQIEAATPLEPSAELFARPATSGVANMGIQFGLYPMFSTQSFGGAIPPVTMTTEFRNAIYYLFNNFIMGSIVNVGYKSDNVITENRVSHQNGLSEMTVSGFMVLS